MDNLILSNASINESLLNLSIKGHVPAGCDPNIDKIVMEGAKIICYHQYTPQDVIGWLIPVFVVVFIGIAFISYKIVLKYGKKRQERLAQEGKKDE